MKSTDHFKQTIGEYHLKEKSLILSAKKNNLPVETIEYDLEHYKVSQSRGLQNMITDYHDLIIETVNSHKPIFKKIMAMAVEMKRNNQ